MNSINALTADTRSRLESGAYDRAILDQIERQTYGVTIDQIKQCIEYHGGDHADYIRSVTAIAIRTLNDAQRNGPSHADLEKLRIYLNRIGLASRFATEGGLTNV